MWTHTLDPVLFQIFGLEVRYYGLVYVIGFLLGWYFLHKARDQLGLSKDEVSDFIFYLMLGVIIGSRLFHVVFWEPAYYFSQPWKIFYVWEGGMAYHGGLVGSIVAGYWYCKKKGASFFKAADILSVPALIALGLGRIANFINAELVGRVTDVSWCVNFGDGFCRHPYTLYSAVKRFALAGVLFWVGRLGLFKDGFIFWSMIFLMGIGRFFLDFYREGMLYVGLGVGQWMSLVMVILGGIMLFRRHREDVGKLLA